jgi:hypothetical protein
MQTGPTRWESFPVYEEDAAVDAAAVISPPEIVIPEPPTPRSGPRAF